jgi:uncharacterized protein (TIGR03435 family)
MRRQATRRAKRIAVGYIALAIAGSAYAQVLHADRPTPLFAVASIKPSPPDAPNFERRVVRKDGLLIQEMTVRNIIKYAYGLAFERELSGGPKWIETALYDIEAKPDEALMEWLSKASGDDRDEQMRVMLQSLLAERFHLKVSFQKKELPVYRLVIAKSGLKCAKVAAETPFASTPQPRFRWTALPPPPPPPPGYIPPSPEQARAQTQTMHYLTKYFPFWLVATEFGHQPELNGLILIDETGLSGNYDCELTWSRVGSDGTGPSFFTAVQEQMGLKLELVKRQVETVVIDSIERPSQN